MSLWVLVPVHPTLEMLEALDENEGDPAKAWEAALRVIPDVSEEDEIEILNMEKVIGH